MDNASKIEKALKEYALSNRIDQKTFDYIKNSIPYITAQTRLLTKQEIENIKSQVPQEKLKELEQTLKNVR